MIKLQNDLQNKPQTSLLPIRKYLIFDGLQDHKEVYNWSMKGFVFDIPGLTPLPFVSSILFHENGAVHETALGKTIIQWEK